MATIRKRNSLFQAIVRVTGHPTQTKSFAQKKDAKQWSMQTELKFRRDNAGILKRKFPRFRDLAQRYLGEVSAEKRCFKVEKNIILKILKDEHWVEYKIDQIKPSTLVEFRKRTLKNVSSDTFNRRFDVISNIFTVCKKEWDYPIDNPCFSVKRPKRNNPRNRRLSQKEIDLLLKGNRTTQELRTFIEIALETGMRKGEILRIRREYIKGNTLHIPVAKTEPRTIPLTLRAVSLLKNTELPLRLNYHTLDKQFRTLVRHYKIKDLRIHDLRHQSLTDFMFKKKLTVPETMLISGHSDPRMLLRVYNNLKVEEVAQKLRS